MAWDKDPKKLLRGSFALAALTATFSLAGLWDQRGFPVAGALTALAGFLAGYRAWAIEHLRRLTPTQRATLVEQLRRALMMCGSRWDVPLVVRVAAVNDDDASAYARLLLRVLRKSGWRADGVFKAAEMGPGLSLAVSDGQRPPEEAREIILAFRAAGLVLMETEKAALDRHSVELGIGLKR
jgi:hypothetical protein